MTRLMVMFLLRCLTVHPLASIVLTGSDDMTIKAWGWERGWKNIQVGII
jgi:coatomer subunit beta'